MRRTPSGGLIAAILLLCTAVVVAAQRDRVPLGLDLYRPWPDANPPTEVSVALGRSLFHDARLSADGSLACASCHDPERAFANNRERSIGVFGRLGARNVPAIINRAWGRSFFWDGRVTTLEEQVLRPIEAFDEMGSTAEEAAARVGLEVSELARALANYVRSILAGDSPYDRHAAGDPEALVPEPAAGMVIFRGKGRCTSCHTGPTFTDEQFHNTGVAWDAGGQRYLDAGRWMVTGADSDRGSFKTPTLREVARTAPYMHDGSLARLEDVIEFYDRGGRSNPNLDMDIRPLDLTPGEKDELVAFLRSLSGQVWEGGHRSR